MKTGRFAVLVVLLLCAVALTGCLSDFPFVSWFYDDGPSGARGSATPAPASVIDAGPAQGSGPAPAPAAGSGTNANQPGASLSCYYSERMQCWATFSNPKGQQVDYFWSVNSAPVNNGQTNGADVAHSFEPAAPGEYVIGFSAHYPDDTWANATVVETIVVLAGGDGSSDGSPTDGTDACPGGVYILGVCADE